LAAAQSTSTPGSSLSIGIKGGLARGTIETDDELNLEHRRGVTLDARCTLGLTNVDDSSVFDEFTSRTISVMIGYRLR
jgi:hypothetical protein